MEKNMTDEVLKESSEYDNFIGKSEKKNTLNEFFADPDAPEPVIEDVREWEKHWKGMPEYKNEDNPPYKLINIRFRTKEDYEKFAEIIGQNLTEKTKSIWYPELDRFANSSLAWMIEEESNDDQS